jgi:glycosyltransferase involved in cell wall biosynthesis
MRYALLIPAYNEEKSIANIIRDASRHVQDIFVVDDGSKDRTALIARKAGAHVIIHQKNMGKGTALLTGFSEIIKGNFDAVITMDADGQHLPSEIPLLVAAFERGDSDIIIGERLIHRQRMPIHRSLANRIGEFFISRAVGTKIRDTQSGFRIYKREVIKRIRIETTGFEMETEILLKSRRAGFRIGTVPITTVYPKGYSSHVRPVRDFYRISIFFLRHLLKKNCLSLNIPY